MLGEGPFSEQSHNSIPSVEFAQGIKGELSGKHVGMGTGVGSLREM